MSTDAEAAIDEVEQQFSQLFARVRTRMRERAARIDPALGTVAYSALVTLTRCGPLRAGELAETLGVDPSILSRTAKELEELGYLTRRRDDADHRVVFLAVSGDAAERVRRERATEQEAFYSTLRDWDVAEVAKLGELLARLNRIGDAPTSSESAS